MLAVVVLTASLLPSTLMASEAAMAATRPLMTSVENGLRVPFRPLTPQTPRWTLAERMAHYGVPGVSLAVIEDGQVEWARGYGVTAVGGHEPVTPRTRFQAASISKPITAALALSLTESGALSLEADFEPLLDGWRLVRTAGARNAKVSLRDVLSHCAGIGVGGFPGYTQDEQVPTLRQVLEGSGPAKTRKVILERPPRTGAHYSGGGYALVQYAIEVVTKHAFSTVATQRLFEPLGMVDSTFGQPRTNEETASIALAHDTNGAPLPGGWRRYPEKAAAGLWSTPTDLSRFAVALIQAWAGQEGPAMSPAMASAMLTEVMDGWGLGVHVTGEGYAFRLSHGGANQGYRAFLMAFPATGQGLVVMTNADNGDALAMEILQSVSDVYDWPTLGLAG